MNLGHSEANISGGHDFKNEQGMHLGRSEANISGGHDFQNDHGMNIGHSEANILGGENFHSTGQNLGSESQMFKPHDPFSNNQIHDHFSGIRTNLLGKIS